MRRQCQSPKCRRFLRNKRAWIGGRCRPAPKKYCSIECYAVAKRGQGHDNHVRVRINGKRVYLHRHVMEQKLGRPLTDEEIVHHKDDNKQNNHPDNLELCKDQAAHLAAHDWWRDKRRIGKKTPACLGKPAESSDIEFWQELASKDLKYDDEVPF